MNGPRLLDSLTRTAPLAALAPQDQALVAALRLWVMMAKLGHCPAQAVTQRLGCARAAAHLHLMLEEVGAAWPEPFCAAPPCCPRLSHDEALIVEMIRCGRDGDRPAFDRLLAEMLPAEMRERLFLSASVLGRVAACL